MKAARAVDLDESVVEPWGLAGDRRWLLVDEDGRFVSQREEPSLARVVVTQGPGTIGVSSAGYPGCQIAAPAAPDGAHMLKVTVWGSTVLVAAAGPEGDAWFSAYLGRPVRLVYLDDPTRRPVDPEFGREGDVVTFADGYPLQSKGATAPPSSPALRREGNRRRWQSPQGNQHPRKARLFIVSRRQRGVLAGFEADLDQSLQVKDDQREAADILDLAAEAEA